MTPEAIIERLANLPSPDRSTDKEIALLTGWKRITRPISGTAATVAEVRTIWISPSGQETLSLPHFTSSIHDAYLLARYLVPSHVGGCSWEDGKGSARLNGGPFFTASGPAIALCMATIHACASASSNE